MGFVSRRLSDLSSAEAYDLMVAAVAPRPIAFISTVSSAGKENLAPFSFYMVGGFAPPSLMYSATLDLAGRPKDSLKNAIETGEFVVNCVHRELAEGMSLAASDLPVDRSEWESCGVTPVEALMVRPRRIAESKIQFECRVFKVVEHGSGPGAARYVIGEVLCAHFPPEILSDPGRFEPIARLAGPRYLDLAAMEEFDLPRPTPRNA